MGHRRPANHINLRYDGHADRQNRARTVAAIAGEDPASERFHKAAADRETETGSGAPPILRLNPVEFIEDALEIGRRNSRPLIDDLDLDEFPVALCPQVDAASGGGIFRGVIKKIEQD